MCFYCGLHLLLLSKMSQAIHQYYLIAIDEESIAGTYSCRFVDQAYYLVRKYVWCILSNLKYNIKFSYSVSIQ